MPMHRQVKTSGRACLKNGYPLFQVAQTRESCLPPVCRKLGLYYYARRRRPPREYESYLR